MSEPGMLFVSVLAGMFGFCVGCEVERRYLDNLRWAGAPTLTINGGHFPCDRTVVLTIAGGMVTAECRQ